MRTAARLILAALLAAPFVGVTPTAAAAPVTVVVTMADPLLSVPAALRPAAITEAQRSLLHDLGGRTPTDVRSLRSANVLVATVSAAQRRRLAADPRVAAIGVDAPMPAPVPEPAPAAPLPPVEAPAAACTGTEAEPQLEPEALRTLNVRSDDPTVPTAASLGYDGAGVTVGIISTNLDPDAPNFIRPDGRSAVVDYQAYVADGTQQVGMALEAFGDVSAVVSQGAVTYDLADVVAPDAVTLPGGHCWIRVVGMAPAADVVATNAYDADSLTTAGAVLSIDRMVAAGVDVINESFDSKLIPDVALRAAIQTANDAALDAGVTVVASSGDAGANNTIGNPASDPRVISVGASTDARVAAQVGGYGLTRFGNGTWRNGTTSIVSSAGFTQAGHTIDVVAPGDSDWSSCSDGARFLTCAAVGDSSRSADLVNFGGTSQSAPFVTGVVALVVQAYRDGHGGQDPTPDQVQRLVTSTAEDLGLPADLQGAGQVDAYAAVLAARSLPADGLAAPLTGAVAVTPPDTGLVADVAQFSAVGSQAQTLRTTVVNTGTAPATITPTVTTDRTDDSTTTTHPVAFSAGTDTFVDGIGGHTSTSTTVRVDVPADVPWFRLRLNSVPTGPIAITEAAVFTPDGTLAGFAESAAGFQLWLPRPEAGSWSVVLMATPGLAYTGDLQVDLGVRSVLTTGSPTVVPPGGSAAVELSVPAPAAPGDTAATLRLGPDLSLPVVLRRPVDLSAGSATVAGTLAPVNGFRTPFQTATWEFDVPAGRRSLSAGLQVDEVGIEASAALVGPDGSAHSLTGGRSRPGGTGAALTQAVADPVPGRWRYTVVFWDVGYRSPSPGAPFRVDLALGGVQPSADGLPSGGPLPVGTSVPVQLTVTNPGPAPLALLVDARTDETVPVTLTDVADAGDVTLPVVKDQVLPVFQVPAFTSRLRVGAVTDVPTVLEVNAPTGDPDTISSPGTAPAVTVEAPVVPGPWATTFSVPGAVGDTRSPDGSARVTAIAETLAYDTTITDGTGVPVMTAQGPSADVAPTTVAPGSTATVTVLVPVTAPEGTPVTGLLALVTAPQAADGGFGLVAGQSSGDVVARFPYAYVVAAAPGPTPTPDPAPTSAVVDPTPGPTPTTAPDPTTAAPVTTAATMTTAATPVTAAPTHDAGGPLAYTGTDARTPGLWGLLLLVIGSGFVVSARRRRGRHRPE